MAAGQGRADDLLPVALLVGYLGRGAGQVGQPGRESGLVSRVWQVEL